MQARQQPRALTRRTPTPLSSVRSRARGLSRAELALGIGAATLGALAIFNRKKALDLQERHPARGSFVQIGPTRVHYLEQGHGNPVVLIHGNLVSAQDFQSSGLLERLALNHRVIAFDRPGMGYSERTRGLKWTPFLQADVLRQAWEQLGVEQPIVVGHSFGTIVALSIAMEHPESIAGLVLLSGYYYPTLRPEPLFAAPSATPLLGDVLNHTVMPLINGASVALSAKALFFPAEVPLNFVERSGAVLSIRAQQIRAEAEDSIHTLSAVMQIQSRYPEVQVPVAIIAGEKDKAVSAEHSMRLHQELSRSTLRIAPGVGHMVHYADRDAVVAAVADMSGADYPRAAAFDEYEQPCVTSGISTSCS